MNRRELVSFLLAGSVAPAFAQKAKAYSSPLAAVQAVYDPKIKEAQRPYSRRLRALYAAAIKKSHELNEPVSGLDFDPTTNSQDSDDDFRKTLKYTVEPRPNRNARVIVKLKVFKQSPETTLHYEVVPEGEGFVIDDVIYLHKTDGWTLSTMLEAGAKGQ